MAKDIPFQFDSAQELARFLAHSGASSITCHWLGAARASSPSGREAAIADFAAPFDFFEANGAPQELFEIDGTRWKLSRTFADEAGLFCTEATLAQCECPDCRHGEHRTFDIANWKSWIESQRQMRMLGELILVETQSSWTKRI